MPRPMTRPGVVDATSRDLSWPLRWHGVRGCQAPLRHASTLLATMPDYHHVAVPHDCACNAVGVC